MAAGADNNDKAAATLAGRSMQMGKAAVGCCGKSCSGFRDFILRGNVVDMAIGIVVGGAFTQLVNAVVADWITPLIGAIWGGGNFNDLTFSVNGSIFKYGHFINTLITFLIICLVLFYAVVLPMNMLVKAMYPPKVTERPGGCPFCGNAKVPYTAIKCGACCSELPPLPADTLNAIEEEERAKQEGAGDEEVKKSPVISSKDGATAKV